MLRADELVARAQQLGTLAATVVDPSYAKSLRQHARYWLDLAAEMRVLENDPLYRCIHDRPEVEAQGERAIAQRG